jgi:hypothetical protein
MFHFGCIFIQHVYEVILSSLREKIIIRSDRLCGNLKGMYVDLDTNICINIL